MWFRKKMQEFKDRSGGFFFLLFIAMVCGWVSPVFLFVRFMKRFLRKRK